VTSIPWPRELPGDDWDARTVERPGGHVYQSVAWAAHRLRSGWVPRFLDTEGGPVLALTRRWPWLAGGSAYVARGPAPPGRGDIAGAVLEGVTRRLAGEGVDVVATDAEVPAADDDYRAILDRLGFRQIEEIQPSRHRVSLPLDPTAGEEAAFGGIAKSTRQRIRRAEQAGILVVQHDRRATHGVGEGFQAPAAETERALERFYELLRETGERRQFRFGPRTSFVPWWRAAHEAGHLVLLEAFAGEQLIAGLVLYRHGERLTTVHSGDHAETRDEHAGASHLLRWRAIQLALRENRAEMDLGGVDVPGARRQPVEGEPTWGLYRHKLSFGGQWLELAGAHETVLRPWRYAVGRLIARITRR
jgi:hypothetical protein